MLIYGQFDREPLDARWPPVGSATDPKIRVRRSWDPFDPDSTIGLARTKKLLGRVRVHVTARAVPSRSTTRGAPHSSRRSRAVPRRASAPRATTTIKADLAAALQAVVDAGLAGAIDVANANTYGGCFGPRFSRIVGTQLGSLSRHTWAQALDTNTVANCQGCVPQMDCRVVRIFRKHNFAWGGNFINPDGMHFEWVGEPRNTYQYPSRYCPNVPSGGIESFGSSQATTRSVLDVRRRWLGARRTTERR